MNSLEQLNNYSNTEYEYTDNRPAGVFFDRATATNQSVSILEGQQHYVPWGIEITDIANYADELPYVEFDITNLDNYNASFNITFGTLLGHMTLTQPTANKVYRISGLRSQGDWEYIKNTVQPRIVSPSDVYGNFTYTVKVGGATTNKAWTVNLAIANVILLTTPTSTTYNSGATSTLTGEPQINNPAGENLAYIIDITPVDYTEHVVEIFAGGSGGAVSWDSGTKTLQLNVSNQTQANSRLSNLSIQTLDGFDYTFRLRYTATATGGETDTVYQTLVSSDNSILGAVRGSETYTLNTTANITNGPLITDSSYTGTGVYQLVVSPNDPSAVGSLDITVPTGTFTSTDEYDLGIQDGTNEPTHISMSSDARTMAVGFPNERPAYGPESDANGEVRIFTKTLTNDWSSVTTLTNELSAASSQYGTCVQLSTDGDRLYVVAAQDTNPSGTFDNVRDCIVVYNGNPTRTIWTQQGDLITAPSNGSGGYLNFGKFAVSRDESTIVIAHPASSARDERAFVYIKTESGWEFQSSLDLVANLSIGENYFAKNVAISNDGNTAIVSCSYETNTMPICSRVLYYKRTGTSWSLVQTMSAPNEGSVNNNYGTSISLSGDGLMLTIGDPLYSSNTGRVYVLSRTSGGLFSTFGTFDPTVGTGNRFFGQEVTISPDKLQMIVTQYFGNYESAIIVYNRTPSTNFTFSQTIRHSFAAYFGGYQSYYDPKTAMSDDKSNIVAYGYVLPNTSVPQFLESFTTSIGKFYDEANGELVVTGTKSAINTAIDTITYTPATDYTSDFDLLYQCETPTNGQTIKNQTVTRTT